MKVPFLDISATYKELKHEMDSAVHSVLKKGMFIMGENVTKFEEESAKCRICTPRQKLRIKN